MKKKLMIGLLTVVACFTISSTSFAASATTPSPNTTPSETSNVITPAVDSKWATEIWTYNKLHYPLSSSVPTFVYHADAPYYGYLPLLSLETRNNETGQFWIATYQGIVYTQ